MNFKILLKLFNSIMVRKDIMKKKIITAGALCALLVSGASITTDAESIKEERVLQKYSFTVPNYLGNAISTNYYRGDANSKWQVSLDTTDEGVGTVMSYWIEAGNNTNLSKVHNVKHGTGVKAFDDVNYRGYVHLTSRNNNNNDRIVKTTGRWDEE